MAYRPELLLVDDDVIDLPFTQSILSRLPGVPLEQASRASNQARLKNLDTSLTKGKRTLHLKRFAGAALKLCPGYTDELLCCNYQVIDLVENCPLECSYCILQAFLNKPIISLHVNVEEIMAQVKATLAKNPTRKVRIGTGEHSDSLALDHLFYVNPYLIEEFADLPNASLELKTKTNQIDHLLGLNHGGHTVIAFSVNPPEIVKKQEFKTASLAERLIAARKLADDGYKLAFHFDPLIHYPGWEEGYQEVVEEIFKHVRPQEIAWVSLGTLRYIPKLKQIAEERFPGCGIFSDEFIPGEEGKRQYFKPIRKKMLQKVGNWLSEASGGETPLYICMEKSSLWEGSMPVIPKDAEELERHLTDKF